MRTLVREPLKVKCLTRTAVGEAKRRRAIDEILDEVLRERLSKISLSKLVLQSRR